jgi:hypothetical protein
MYQIVTTVNFTAEHVSLFINHAVNEHVGGQTYVRCLFLFFEFVVGVAHFSTVFPNSYKTMRKMLSWGSPTLSVVKKVILRIAGQNILYTSWDYVS